MHLKEFMSRIKVWFTKIQTLFIPFRSSSMNSGRFRPGHWAVQQKAPLFLGLIVSLVAATNYTPGTFLTGWDNLHPEFAFGMNIKRSIFAVWQEYQGLGLLGGMGHASDLPRQVFLWFMSFFMPLSFVRYFYHFLMLYVGVFGVYVLLKRYLLVHLSESIRTQAAFLGALFYLLNLGTIQYFLIPFEPYSTFWGFFPWEILVAVAYLSKPTTKRLLLLALVNFLAVPQAYVQTIFLVYMLCLSMLFGNYLLSHWNRVGLWIVTKVLIVILCVNAFWLLPNIYFVIHDVKVTQNAIHNILDTEKFFHMNKNRGTLTDFIFLKEFNYDFVENNPVTKKPDYMMRPWMNHVESLPGIIIGLLSFMLVLYGLTVKHTHQRFLIGIFVLAAIVFLSDTVIIATINELLRVVPIINQIFRNPFSKFIVPAIFVFTALFAIGVGTLLERYQGKKVVERRIPLLVLTCVLLWYGLPAFFGNFLSWQVRIGIPQNYFDLFSYMATQDKNARIMNMPQGSFWGWGTYSWGHTGSGFLWYGIEQPITDRAFDVWSKDLEGFYWESVYAIRKKDQKLFNNILEKYQIGYVLYDPSYAPSDATLQRVLYQQEGMLQGNPKVKLEKSFGTISLYKVNLTSRFQNNILVKSGLPTVTRNEQFSNKDVSFSSLSSYQVDKKDPSYLFPFESLFTNRLQGEEQFGLQELDHSFVLSGAVPKGTYTVSYPSIIASEPFMPLNISAKLENNVLGLKFSLVAPEITVDGKSLLRETFEKEVAVGLDRQIRDGDFIVAINKRDFYEAHDLTSEYTFLGNTYFYNAYLGNSISVYTTTGSKDFGLDLKKFSPPGPCDGKKAEYVEVTRKDTEMVMYTKNNSACALYKQALLPQEAPLLLRVGFNYQSDTDEYPSYCLSSVGQKGCINTEIIRTSRHGFATKLTRFQDFVEVPPLERGADFVSILDGTSEEDVSKVKKMTYGAYTITAYSQIATFIPEFGQEVLTTADYNFPLSVMKQAQITVSVPKVFNSYSYPDLLGRNIYKKTATTSPHAFPEGNYYLQTLSENGVRLYAKNTNAQFWFNLLDAPANVGYVVSLKTRNVNGFPAIINTFTPQDNNKYIYTYIAKGKDYQQNYFVLPTMYEFDKGFKILLMSSSYNRIPSVNDIKDVSAYPLPYEFLTNIMLTKDGYTPQKSQDRKPLSTQKINITKYTAVVSPDEKGVLILSQSYHPGWKAYEVVGSNWQLATSIKKMMPFWFGNEIKEHVVVNGWENGWVLDNRAIEQYNNITIVLVFLPQYLEYVGFGLFILGFCIPFVLPRLTQRIQ